MADDPDDRAAAELSALRTELLGRLDTLSQELRRQGRASLGAQAAAEACLEALQRGQSDEGEAGPDREAVAAAASRAEAQRWLRALLPVLDALERVAAQAAAAANEPPPPPPPPRSLLGRLLGLGDPAPQAPSAVQASQRSLHQGLGLLQQLAQQSLEGLGVRVERATGVALDPQRHRVVEARPGQGEAEARVLEVVRPGYLLGDVCVREADVVASRGKKG